MPSLSALLRRVASPPLRRMADEALSTYHRAVVARLLVQQEFLSGPTVSMPFERRLSLWRHGFTSRSGVLFDLDEGEYDEYLSNYQLEQLGSLGGSWTDAADNEVAAHMLLQAYDDHLPDLYGMLDTGTLRRHSPLTAATPDGSEPPARAPAIEALDAYFDEYGTLVLKPLYGSGGLGVQVCRRSAESEGYVVNGEEQTRAAFADRLADAEEYLVWEFVEQTDYADRLFPDAANTLRVLTLRDPETGDPFVSGAAHRIGTPDSAPVDNWNKGGLSAEVRDDGTLSAGAQWDSTAGELRWHETHPATGAPIEGVAVPEWSTIHDRVLEMARTLSSLPRIGWDIVVTDDEFVVLEINTHPGVDTIQVHRPHLRDPRTRRFYEHHGFA